MTYDLLVVGGGIVGLTIALRFLLKFPKTRVLIVEKEKNSISHGTGRNSGVVHSGIYYDKGSLRARLCVSGSKQIIDYAESKNLWIDRCGKLLIPTSEKSLNSMELLIKRGVVNGVEVKQVDGNEALDLEPRVNVQFDAALFVPITAVVNPKSIAQSLVEDVKGMGAIIRYDTQVVGIDSRRGCVRLKHEYLEAAVVINASGLHADQVAKKAGLDTRYRFQPFKGKYWRHKDPQFRMHRLVYPIPDLNLPFLGIHTAHNQRGHVFFGPSSTPAIGRENYNGVDNLKLAESIFLGGSLLWKLMRNTNGLRALAIREAKLLGPNGVCQELSRLVRGVKAEQLEQSRQRVGIRSQIFDPASQHLVNDFVIVDQGRTIHILNAISPAFSASFAFADHILEQHIR